MHSRLLLILVTSLIGTATIAGAAESRRPNIVFIIADDLGYRDVGAFGQDKIRTPNIDRLAAEGMKLTTHYSGNTVCAPSRAVLMSGKHPGHAFIRDNRQAADFERVKHEGQWPVPPNECQLPLTLQSLNYATGGFGKWGLGPWNSTGNPNRQGFDQFFGYICQYVAHNYYPEYLWDNGQQVPLDNREYERPARLSPGDDPDDPKSYERFNQGQDYAPDLIHERAMQFLRQNKNRPFFFYYPSVVPHLGYQVPEDSLKQYLGEFPEEPYAGSGNYVPTPHPRAVYAAMITRMDDEIGRIIDFIVEAGLEDETIFVFTSDNGAPGGIPTSYFNSGGVFRGNKGSAYEGGFRVPTVVKWKGRIEPGTESDRITGFEDWLPTLLDLAGAAKATPRDIDGISFAPTLLGETQPPRPFLYREFPTRGGAQIVRAGDWKLIRHLGNNDRVTRDRNGVEDTPGHMALARPGAEAPATQSSDEYELFNLENDPSEQSNVAAEHPDIVERLKQVMTEQHTPSELFPLRGDAEPRR